MIRTVMGLGEIEQELMLELEIKTDEFLSSFKSVQKRKEDDPE